MICDRVFESRAGMLYSCCILDKHVHIFGFSGSNMSHHWHTLPNGFMIRSNLSNTGPETFGKRLVGGAGTARTSEPRNGSRIGVAFRSEIRKACAYFRNIEASSPSFARGQNWNYNRAYKYKFFLTLV
jgi:hypothetical protein